eukprot:6180272-Pleurochrysis_carterae.AAC.1
MVLLFLYGLLAPAVLRFPSTYVIELFSSFRRVGLVSADDWIWFGAPAPAKARHHRRRAAPDDVAHAVQLDGRAGHRAVWFTLCACRCA